MDQSTLDKFRDFLTEKNHVYSTINGYVRMLGLLSEPPVSEIPEQLFTFIENDIKEKEGVLSKSNYQTYRAALNAFFLMKTGLSITEYRKQCIPCDRYDSFLIPYTDYCLSFLHLSSDVALASVRETKLFLKYVTTDPWHTEWKAITAKDVISFLNTERSTLSVSSIGVTVTAIRRFFRFLQYKDFKINESVLTLPLSVPNWSKGGKLPVTLTVENQKRIDDHSYPDTPIGYRDQAILYCFTELGLRCREVANLQLNDIKWNTGTIIIRKTKTHMERELPLSNKLGTALEDYVIHARSPQLGSALFYKSKYRIDEPASPENIRAVIRRLFNKNEITGNWLGTHALRRTVGSNLYSNGNSLKTVADLLGHTSLSATKAYVRVDVEALRAIASDWPRRNENG